MLNSYTHGVMYGLRHTIVNSNKIGQLCPYKAVHSVASKVSFHYAILRMMIENWSAAAAKIC